MKSDNSNDLQKIFNHHTGRAILKWDHYFEIYEQFFSKYRNREVVILEIGVYQGGSLQMWKSYFGPKASLYAIDIHPSCKQFEDDQTKIFIGSQSDPAFLHGLMQIIPRPDIILDDGGHMMHQQITAFEHLFDHLKEGGVYLIEDLHTSYWKEYDGGYQRKNTFIEYSKGLIDQLHAYHSRTRRLKPNRFTTEIRGLHFFDSIVVVEKGSHPKPHPVERGVDTIDRKEFQAGKKTWFQRLMRTLARLKKTYSHKSE